MLCNVDIFIIKNIYVYIEVRKRVINFNIFLRGRGLLVRRKFSGRKGVFVWIYIGGWVVSEGRV